MQLYFGGSARRAAVVRANERCAEQGTDPSRPRHWEHVGLAKASLPQDGRGPQVVLIAALSAQRRPEGNAWSSRSNKSHKGGQL